MGTVSQASSTALSLREVYKAAGKDYTGLAEYSDVSGYSNGTNDYTLKSHVKRLAECSGLKPNTRVWPRLDGRDISPYCKMKITGDFGSPLMTDSLGNCDFYYKIPNDATMKFRGLKHLLELSDVKPPGSGANEYGISSGKVGATTRCGQYLYFPSNKNGFDHEDIQQTSNITLTELLADKSQTVIKSTAVEEEVPDYISQSFTVSKKGIDGIFCKRIYLYFAEKSSDADAMVYIQLRETGKGGRPTDNVIAQSERVYADNSYHPDDAINVLTGTAAKEHMVNISSDASDSTTFRFAKPIQLKNNTQYAITVLSNEDQADFKLFTAVDNSQDIGSTKKNANFSPLIGPLYGSASGDVWSKLPNEALKMFIGAENFVTNQSATFVIENQDLEFLNISDMNPSSEPTADTGFQIDEVVRGESILNIDHTAALSVGDRIQNAFAKDNPGSLGATSYVDGTIRSIGSSGATGTTGATGFIFVKVDALRDFTASEAIYKESSQVGTVGATVGFVANTCFGYATFINSDFGRLRLNGSTADSATENKFQAGKYVRGQSKGATAKIDGVVDPKVDEIDIRTPFTSGNKTSIDWYIKTTDAGTATPDSQWARIAGNKELKFTDKQKQIFSKSNQSFKSILLRGDMITTDANVSPEVEIDDITVVAKRQRINNSVNNENLPAGESTARFISKVIKANRFNSVTGDATGEPSERIMIDASAYYPEGSEIKGFIRVKNDADPEPISDKQYTLMSQVDTGRSVLGEMQDKSVIVFYPAANVAGDEFLECTVVGQLGVTGMNNVRMDNTDNIVKYQNITGAKYDGLNEFQIKLVFTKPENSGTAYAPEISDLTAITHDKPLAIT